MALDKCLLVPGIPGYRLRVRAPSCDDPKLQLHCLAVLICMKLSHSPPWETDIKISETEEDQERGSSLGSLHLQGVFFRLNTALIINPVVCLSVSQFSSMSAVLGFLLTLAPWGCVRDKRERELGGSGREALLAFPGSKVTSATTQFFDFSSVCWGPWLTALPPCFCYSNIYFTEKAVK